MLATTLDAATRHGSYPAMNGEKTTPPPNVTAGRSAMQLRRQREAEALRANLRKRKDQQRARAAVTQPIPRDDPPEDDRSGRRGEP